ncbi:hypothetical protein AVEN_214566-1 [Araneus ventricosus]|uniref:Uncharacterized protein n=1 Tax=Araneus ventricosus TaxID=182803 RepID=A0A4Y2L5G2_ARAVE|nr:hypothetical protein AVEN_214566-1 [Araneus ventricosus]
MSCLHLLRSRSTQSFVFCPKRRLSTFGFCVVPQMGGAIWWIAESLTVLLCCILQQRSRRKHLCTDALNFLFVDPETCLLLHGSHFGTCAGNSLYSRFSAP